MKSAIDTEIMPYTNYTYDFKGMIDYIFYPRQSMKPLGFLGPIDAAWLKENKVIGCPHPHLNSGINPIWHGGGGGHFYSLVFVGSDFVS